MRGLLDLGRPLHVWATCFQRGFNDALELFCGWSDLASEKLEMRQGVLRSAIGFHLVMGSPAEPLVTPLSCKVRNPQYWKGCNSPQSQGQEGKFSIQHQAGSRWHWLGTA